MSAFLGVDGGGSKTAFLLIDGAGRILARHIEGSAYHPEVGIEGVRTMFERGCAAAAAAAGMRLTEVSFSFLEFPRTARTVVCKPPWMICLHVCSRRLVIVAATTWYVPGQAVLPEKMA